MEIPLCYNWQTTISNKAKRRVFAYKQMNQDLWQNFADQVTSNLQHNNAPLTTNTPESLEASWHKIQSSIITAALQHIPNKKFTVRNFQHVFSAKASNLHLGLKQLGNIIRQVKASIRNHTSVPTSCNQDIDHLNSSHHLSIPALSQDLWLPDWIAAANTEWKTLYHARNLENIKNIREQINDNISKRCTKLQNSPTSMINSILNRHKDPVRFDNIKEQNNIITEPSLIKQHIQQHFDDWTAPRNIQSQLFNTM